MTNGEILRKNKPIKIGCRNWIGNHTTIMKGTQTPNDCIIASNSLLNKDYGSRSNVMIAGTPAKIIGEGMARIYDVNNEFLLDQLFKLDTSLNFINSEQL